MRPEGVYALTKTAGETRDAMVLRTSIVGEEIQHFHSLLSWAIANRGKAVEGYTNHIWNGVTTIQLCEVIEAILAQNRYQPGIFHLHSPKPVTKHQLLGIFNTEYGLDLTVRPTQAPRPIDLSLTSVHALSRELVTRPIREQIAELREFHRKQTD